jgi:hypothetical protein
MVDVLWKEGREEAAIQLELLWKGLAGRYGFALLAATRWEISSSKPSGLRRSAGIIPTSFRSRTVRLSYPNATC